MTIDQAAVEFALTRIMFEQVLGKDLGQVLREVSEADRYDMPNPEFRYTLNGYYFAEPGGYPDNPYIRLCMGSHSTIYIQTAMQLQDVLATWSHVIPRNRHIRHADVVSAMVKLMPFRSWDGWDKPQRLSNITVWKNTQWLLINQELYAILPQWQLPVRIRSLTDFENAYEYVEP